MRLFSHHTPPLANPPDIRLSLLATRVEDMLLLDPEIIAKDAAQIMAKENLFTVSVGTQTPTGILSLTSCVNNETTPIKNIITPPLYLPETLRIGDGLFRMRQEGTDITLLVDEQGNVTGQLYIEDILDAWLDTPEDPIDDITLDNLDGRTSLSHVFDLLNKERPEVNVKTVAGWVMSYAGRIPSKGEKIEIDGLDIHILDTSIRRVRRLSISQKTI